MSAPLLPPGHRVLRYLFLDLNAYFASVEQQMDPSLRGRPIVVGPVMSDTSVAIAASYEAKAYGIRTGTKIGDAKRMCPELLVVPGHHSLYSTFHKRIVAAVSTVLPVEAALSIDEMYCRLLGAEREPGNARALGIKIKRAIQERVGECLTCSVGIGPNVFLAKTATDMQKPDGLVVIEASDLPDKLLGMQLTDFTGINKRMAIRLGVAGIFTAEQMLAADKDHLRRAFGSVIGEKWWYLLRGYDLQPSGSSRRSLGHSHVMAPKFRTDTGCKEVLLRLLHKAAARMRSENLAACRMAVQIDGMKAWHAEERLDPTCDATTLTDRFLRMWSTRDFLNPFRVGVTFSDLVPLQAITPSLFDNDVQRIQLARAVDRVNQRFGKNSIYLAGLNGARDSAPERIAFNKVELFREGRGDHADYDDMLSDDESEVETVRRDYRFGQMY